MAAQRPHTERPLYKMSVQLIDTYKLINVVYYENKARKTTHSHKEWDDENHDYLIHQGEVFAGRFEIKRRIGKARLHELPSAAVTSAVRYRQDGWWFRPVKNLFCLTLFFLGVPPSMIREIYR